MNPTEFKEWFFGPTNLIRVARSGCLEWVKSKDGFGYGMIRFGPGTMKRCHRVAYVLTKGEIPVGLCVCHKCDNPPCCNPDHLFLGTKKDNSMDAGAKGRMDHHGERNPSCKVTAEKVVAIRAMRKDGFSNPEIAARFGLTKGHISNIVRGWSWSHVK